MIEACNLEMREVPFVGFPVAPAIAPEVIHHKLDILITREPGYFRWCPMRKSSL